VVVVVVVVDGAEEKLDDDDEKVEDELVLLLAWAIVPISKYTPTAATKMMTTANTATTAFPMASRLRFELSETITVKTPYSKVASDSWNLKSSILKRRYL
jgi:hypothetical protein